MHLTRQSIFSQQTYGEIEREKGRLDIVFANAGIAKYAPFGAITEELYDSIFDVNVKGLLFTVQKALPLAAPSGISEGSPHSRERGEPGLHRHAGTG